MLLQINDPLNAAPTRKATPVVGIDLGTTHSLCVLIKDDDTPQFLTPLVPSVVALEGDQFIVGEQAATLLKTNPTCGMSSVKRLMGRGLSDVPKELAQCYKMKTDTTQGLVLNIGEKSLTPVFLASLILKHLKHTAEQTLGHAMEEAVMTVPAYFDEAARAATRDAARLAGLSVRRLINEPTAAALAYGLETKKEGVYGVYDLGGGTFDISVLSLQQGVFRVLATAGHVALGGDDIDQTLAKYLEKKHRAPWSPSEAKRLKEKLSREKRIYYTAPNTSAKKELTQNTLHNLCDPLVNKTLAICDRVLLDLRDKRPDLKGVVLVGGSTRTPLIQQKVSEHFGVPVSCHQDPERLVAIGAAYQAKKLTHKTKQGPVLLDVAPLSLGIETFGGVVEKIIWRNTPLPAKKTEVFTTFQDGQQGFLFHVVQGEREKAKDCRSLAQFELKGLSPMKAGSIKVAVSFYIDVDGLLTVSAQDTETNTQKEIQINPSYGMHPQTIEAMVQESLAKGRQDMEERIAIETQTEAKRLLQRVTRDLKKYGHLLTKTQRSAVDRTHQDLEKALNEPVSELQQALETAKDAIGQNMRPHP